jgi:hypothetical protein
MGFCSQTWGKSMSSLIELGVSPRPRNDDNVFAGCPKTCFRR